MNKVFCHSIIVTNSAVVSDISIFFVQGILRQEIDCGRNFY